MTKFPHSIPPSFATLAPLREAHLDPIWDGIMLNNLDDWKTVHDQIAQ